MSILDRYILREFLKVLVFGILALILVFTVVDLFERIDNIVRNKAPFSVAVTFFLARIPQVVFMVTPISILLATLLVMGAFARHSEVIAMLATGVSIYRMIVPLLLMGLLVSLMMFGLNEFVVPVANRLAEESKRIINAKPDERQLAKIQIWFRGQQERRVYYINALVPEDWIIYELTVFELNDQFLPIKRLDAGHAIYHPSSLQLQQEAKQHWRAQISHLLPKHFQNFIETETLDNKTEEQGTWTLYNGTERWLDTSEKRPIISFQQRDDYRIPRTFSEFRQETKDPEDMNYIELKKYITTLSASGNYNVLKYVVDLHAKFAYPFVSVVMVIIGFPFALKSPRSGAAMGVGLSVFIGISYWILLQLGISLGHAQILPPLIAAWVSHIFFALAGLYFLLSTRT